MENTQLPEDFRDFLRLLSENDVHYLMTRRQQLAEEIGV